MLAKAMETKEKEVKESYRNVNSQAVLGLCAKVLVAGWGGGGGKGSSVRRYQELPPCQSVPVSADFDRPVTGQT